MTNIILFIGTKNRPYFSDNHACQKSEAQELVIDSVSLKIIHSFKLSLGIPPCYLNVFVADK